MSSAVEGGVVITPKVPFTAEVLLQAHSEELLLFGTPPRIPMADESVIVDLQSSANQSCETLTWIF
jgi:hypothetical protein